METTDPPAIGRFQNLKAKLREKGIDKSIEQVMTELYEDSYPVLMKMFYPRVYENIGGYYPPKYIAAWLANIVIEVITSGDALEQPTAHQLMLPSFKRLVEQRIPMFFIAPDFLKAVMMTDFKEELDWNTMDLPFESAIFMLPNGAVEHPKDGGCVCIWYGRKKQGVYPPLFPNAWQELGLRHSAFSMCALCPENGLWYDSNWNEAYSTKIQYENMFCLAQGGVWPEIQKTNLITDSSLEEIDHAFLEKIGVILFGTFLALDARPALLTPARVIKEVKDKKYPGNRKQFWSPNIIGKDYHLKRALGGKHASPRYHWVRGHHKPKMEGRLGRRVWIEPYQRGLSQ
jgi:hypothetical protein